MKIFVILLFAIPLFAEYNPSKITKKDLAEILKLDSNLYEVTKRETPQRKAEMGEIFNFIWKNREIKIDPQAERINLDIVAFAGGRNRSGYNQGDPQEFDYTLNPYAYVGLQGNLKLIDPKETREKKEKIFKQRSEILTKIEKFLHKSLELESIKEQLEILQYKEQLYKARVAEGVEPRATRITNLEALHKKKQDHNKALLDLETMKFGLLELVKVESQNELKRILQ
ncbi:hypothetical protein [Helicobacter rodentium]|uniref:hypothetical protein n=1 Tax=Helicobacter rodentium TaxID=59617 RepID=UPI002356DCDE|nr:hypothetical protein [Helicobacter rodentium]